MSTYRRTSTNNAGDSTLYGANDFHVIVDLLNGSVTNSPAVKFKTTNKVTFYDAVMAFRNPADTFTMTVKTPAIVADRELTLPLLSANDTLMAVNSIQTLLNKTINISQNTFTVTSGAVGDLIYFDGTKFNRLARGSANQVLQVKSDGTDIEYASHNPTVNKGDNLDGAARYLEDTTDPASDSQRIWMVDASNVIKYWSDETTPVKHTLAALGLTQTFTGAQTFTDRIVITDDSDSPVHAERDTNVVNDKCHIKLRMKSSVGTMRSYGAIASEIITNTDGAENGYLYFQVMSGGTLGSKMELDKDGLLKIGANRRLILSESGLASARTMTFPDATDKVVGEATAATLTNKTLVAANNTLTNVVQVLDRATSTSAVTNTAVETSIYSFSVVGGTLSTNKKLRLIILGDYLNDDGASRNFTLKIKYGATTMWNAGAISITNDADRRAVFIHLELSANNATNAQVLGGNIIMTDADALTNGLGTSGDEGPLGTAIIGTATEDSTANKTFDITVTHGTASTNISFRRHSAILELI